jgi:hypothetical protein
VHGYTSKVVWRLASRRGLEPLTPGYTIPGSDRKMIAVSICRALSILRGNDKGSTMRRMDIAASSSVDRDSAAVAVRPLTVRSAITNDPLALRGVDGRSMAARRYRDVAIALADDLGGQDKLSEPAKILVRQAAALTVQVESLQSKIIAGDEIDLEQLTRISNVLGRTLQRLGLKKPSSPQSVRDNIRRAFPAARLAADL